MSSWLCPTLKTLGVINMASCPGCAEVKTSLALKSCSQGSPVGSSQASFIEGNWPQTLAFTRMVLLCKLKCHYPSFQSPQHCGQHGEDEGIQILNSLPAWPLNHVPEPSWALSDPFSTLAGGWWCATISPCPLMSLGQCLCLSFTAPPRLGPAPLEEGYQW